MGRDASVDLANSLKIQLLQVKMGVCGPGGVIAALRNLAVKLNAPEAWIPATIEFNGQVYQVL